MIKALLYRRYWLIKHRPLTTVAFLLAMPLLLHLFLSVILKKIFLTSIDYISYEIWVFPGIVFLVAAAAMFTILYRDLFGFKIYRSSFSALTLAPHSKFKLISSVLIAAIIESQIYIFSSMIILNLLLPESIGWFAFFAIPFFSVIYLFILGNIIISISIFTERFSSFLFLSLLMFHFLILSTSIRVDFNLYSNIISNFLKFNPLNIVISELRSFLFFNKINWYLITVPISFLIILNIMNSILLKNKLKQ